MRMLGLTIGLTISASTGISFAEEAKLIVPESIRNAVLFAKSNMGNGSAFACIYRGKEFIATNLHVANPGIKFQTSEGKVIPLGTQLIYANDADVCLYAINGQFSAFGIEPLEFLDNVQDNTKRGDSVFCIGNSLGNGVLLQSDGEIKAYGSPRLETTTKFVGGNSGGPLVHHETGKVIGIITETLENKDGGAEGERLADAQSDERTQIEGVSYFAHRVDTIQEWKGTKISIYNNTQDLIKKHEESMQNSFQFLVGDPEWREDEYLLKIWNTYREFIDEAKEKTSGSVKITEYVNDWGQVVRRDVRVRRKSVSKADYDSAWERFLRGLEWKIREDERFVEKLQPLGYFQVNEKKRLQEYVTTVRSLMTELTAEK